MKKFRWDTRADGPREPGYVETVEDHLAESWEARKLGKIVRDTAKPQATVVEAPPATTAVKSPLRWA